MEILAYLLPCSRDGCFQILHCQLTQELIMLPRRQFAVAGISAVAATLRSSLTAAVPAKSLPKIEVNRYQSLSTSLVACRQLCFNLPNPLLGYTKLVC